MYNLRYVRTKRLDNSIFVKSNVKLSSNSQLAIYVESLSSMVQFPFNHVKELELSNNCAKQQVKAWDRFFLQ